MIDQLQDTAGTEDVLISFSQAVKAVHAEIKRSASWFKDNDYEVVAGRVIEALVKLSNVGTESRTYKCFCGAEFIIRFPENCNWDDYESGALENAGWVRIGREYHCPLHAEDEDDYR